MQGSGGTRTGGTDAHAADLRLMERRAACRRSSPMASGHSRQDCLRVALVVAEDFGVDVWTLFARTRSTATLALARQTAMYLSHITLGLPATRVGDGFGRHSTTVGHACAVVEERREDPYVDRELTRLETRLANSLTAEQR